jgi:hypothetical protein
MAVDGGDNLGVIELKKSSSQWWLIPPLAEAIFTITLGDYSLQHVNQTAYTRRFLKENLPLVTCKVFIHDHIRINNLLGVIGDLI